MMSRSNLAFMNIYAWDPDHVVNWLKGLDDSLIPYHELFLQAKVDGESLLMLTHGDLTRLGITKIGHQELILEGVELLIHLYHALDNESLQSLCLALECRSRCLHKEIMFFAQTHGENVRLPMSALTHLTNIVDCIKQMVSWLDRAPFAGNGMYVKKRKQLVVHALELVQAAQMDSSVMHSHDKILTVCQQLWEMCQRMIQSTRDSLFIQPAILELATLRKKPDDELGIHIQSLYTGTHVIGGIKPGSPADMCNKIEGGDEVVQVNYHTVLGWQLCKLVKVLKENQKEVILTVKKRPYHPNMMGTAAALKQRRNQQKLQQSTLPKALSKRSSRGLRPGIMDFLDTIPPGTSTEPLLLAPPVKEDELSDTEVEPDNGNDENDNEEEHDNDNVFRSGSESPGFPMVQLPVFEETKQRRATVSGGSPVMQRPSIEEFSSRPKSYTIAVSSPGSEGSGFPSIDGGLSPNQENPTMSDSLSAAKEEDSKTSKEHYVNTVVVTPPTEPPRTSPKNHRSELTIPLGDNPPPWRANTTPAPTSRASPSGSSMAGAKPTPPAHSDILRPDSVAGSYTVNIIGGVPIKIPANRESPPTQSPSSLLRKKTRKNLISGANRRVSCKDLGGGDCQGWLWKKKDHESSLKSKWSKRWFVMKNQHLYFYKDPESSVGAQGVIHLPGFQVSPAPEVKTKKYGFKAHHSGTTFYFAAERQADMAKWMNKLGLAAIEYRMKTTEPDAACSKISENTGYYSESEEDGENSSGQATPLHGSKEDLLAEVRESDDEVILETLRRVPLDGNIKPEKLHALSSKLHIGHEASADTGSRMEKAYHGSEHEREERATPHPAAGRIVVSGMAARLPQCNSLQEFWENLLQGVDMVTEDDGRRFEKGKHGSPPRCGKLPSVDQCDAHFFNLTPGTANTTDPGLRIMLEVAYEAVVDAGQNPMSLKGSRTAVIIGQMTGDACTMLTQKEELTGFEAIGTSRAMMANRLSHFFGVTGPSMNVDTACSSSLQALCLAVEAMMSGRCDAAIVGGVNILLDSRTTLITHKLNMLSLDGACKTFDESANGYVRSEGVVAMYIQWKDVAKRIYGCIHDILDNCNGSHEGGITKPDGENQYALMSACYKRSGLDPHSIDYVECHGTGTQAGDPQETGAICKMFCQGRAAPLLVGSVKTNIGHTEGAAGLASLAKVLLSFKYERLPPNLHFCKPNPNIPGLMDGRLQVVDTATPFHGTTVAINSFGFGGENVHVIITKHPSSTQQLQKPTYARNQNGVPVEPLPQQALVENGRRPPFERHQNGTPVKALSQQPAKEKTTQPPVKRRHPGLIPVEPSSQETRTKTRPQIPVKPLQLKTLKVTQAPLKMRQNGIPVEPLQPQTLEEKGTQAPLKRRQNGIPIVPHQTVEKNGTQPSLQRRRQGPTPVEALSQQAGSKPAVDSCKLLLTSARTAAGAENLLKLAVEHASDEETLALLDAQVNLDPHHLPVRAYAVISKGKVETKTQVCRSGSRPIWYIFPGMGSQWHGMGRDLYLGEPVFRRSLDQCHSCLQRVGFKLRDLLFSMDPQVFGNPQNSFIGITSIQIGLVDVLTHYGIQPSGIIGHSLGELACGYADGCLTMEQAVLAAYWRGKVVKQAKLPPGKMAAVRGLTWEEALEACEGSSVTVACHNDVRSVTLSADADSMDAMVQKLRERRTTVMIVDSAGVAFHSPVLEQCRQPFTDVLRKIIPRAKPRSERWVSTSIPESGSGSSLAATCSAEYHVNNFLSPVLFYEAVKRIPPDALCIEVGPHGLLRSLVKKAVGEQCDVVSMMDKRETDNHAFCLHGIGKCYMGGIEIPVERLHGPVQFPVSQAVPMLAPALRWDHTTSWDVPDNKQDDKNAGGFVTKLSLDSGHFLHDHKVNGQVLYPAAGLVMCAWEALAKAAGKPVNQYPVTLTDFSIVSATLLPTTGTVKLSTQLAVDGTFYISEGSKLVATGSIREGGAQQSVVAAAAVAERSKACCLAKEDIYQALRIRGYDYGPSFQRLQTYDVNSFTGMISWDENWITHLDGLLHLLLISDGRTDFRIPVRIQRIQIDPMQMTKQEGVVPCAIDPRTGSVHSVAVSMEGIEDAVLARKIPHAEPVCQKMYFQPYFPPTPTCPNNAAAALPDDPTCCVPNHLRFCVDTVVENLTAAHVRIAIMGQSVREVEDMNPTKLFKIPGGKVNLSFLVTEKPTDTDEGSEGKVLQLDASDSSVQSVLSSANICISAQSTMERVPSAAQHLAQQAFILLLEEPCADNSEVKAALTVAGFGLRANLQCRRMSMSLYRKPQTRKAVFVHIDEHDEFSWVEELKRAVMKGTTEECVWLISQRDQLSGVVGLIKSLRMENYGEKVRCFFNMDADTVELADVIAGDLLINIKYNGLVGRFCHVDIAFALPRVDVKARHVEALVPGDLKSLSWVESVEAASPSTINVCSTRLDVQDFRIVNGQVPSTESQDIGRDFAGTDSMGRPVMGISSGTCLSTHCSSTDLMWPVPSFWSLSSAATVPWPYITAYYILDIILGLGDKANVLLHGVRTSSVGQALARLVVHHYHGRLVLTSSGGGSMDKAWLRDKLGIIGRCALLHPASHQLRRDLAQTMNRKGSRRRLNAVILLQSGDDDDDVLTAAVPFMAPRANILHVTSSPLATRTLPRGLRSGINYSTFDMNGYECKQSGPESSRLKQLMDQGLTSEAVRPLPLQQFGCAAVGDAFAALPDQNREQSVVVQVREASEKSSPYKAVQKTTFSPTKSYIVTGGLGGLGLELCLLLVHRGARKLVITSRSGITTGYQRWLLSRMEKLGAQVQVHKYDVCDHHQAAALISETIKELGPVGGLFHLAAVVADSYLENQSAEKFQKACGIKISGVANLDALTRQHCMASLDWFVGFSSIASGFGNAGQTNYAFANSSMERIIERRHTDGVPGVSKALQWGLMGDVGIVQRDLGGNDYFVQGSVPQRVPSYLRTLEILLQSSGVVLASIVPNTAGASKGRDGNLLNKVLAVLNISEASTIDEGSTMRELGAESLNITEIHQILGRDYNIPLNPAQLEKLTIKELAELAG